HALAGIRIVVCALMMNTVVTMAKKGIIDILGGVLFVIAFILACFTPIPTAFIVVLAAVAGIIASRCKGGKKS
ncbi:MAG: chromate transporter, partial [Dorea sp.]